MKLLPKKLAEMIGNAAERAKNRVLDQMALALLRNAVPWTTYAYNGAQRGGTGAGMTFSPGRLGVADIKFDFAAIAADRSANSLAALASTDILQAVGVKAGTWVPMVAVDTTTAEGAAATVSVGDGADDNGFVDALSINATGYGSSLITTAYSLATAGGKIYTADDTIDVLLNSNSIDVAVVHLIVPMIDLRPV